MKETIQTWEFGVIVSFSLRNVCVHPIKLMCDFCVYSVEAFKCVYLGFVEVVGKCYS